VANTAADLQAFLDANPSPVDVVPGRFYNVPCARHVTRRSNSNPPWAPIISPVHDDLDVIGFQYLHVHHDTRFWPMPLSAHGGLLSRLGKVLSVDDPSAHSWDNSRELQFAVKRRLCRRQADRWEPVKFTRPLEDKHRRCRIGPDGLCPHRGIPIALGHRLPDGSTVCAGHGLRWSSTGELLTLEATT
jgi:hypothetical protein